jgi:oligoendopeptidase F
MSDEQIVEPPRWDLSNRLYAGIDDKALWDDLRALEIEAAAFHDAFHGRVEIMLGSALYAYEQIKMREAKITGYLDLAVTEHASERLSIKRHEILVRWESVCAEKLEFFEQAVAEIDAARVEKMAAADGVVRAYVPWIVRLREEAKHQLEDGQEEAVAKRAPYGPASWYEYTKEELSRALINFDGAPRSLNELDGIWRRDPDRERRRSALAAMNEALKERMARLSARTLNAVIGYHAIETEDRNYEGPMGERNTENRITQATVDAVWDGLKNSAFPAAREYAQLQAKLLRIKMPEVSDLWAPYAFAPEPHVPFGEALRWVDLAVRQIDPRLAEHVARLMTEKYVDAQPRPGKYTGAFCQTLVLSNRVPDANVIMSYYGTIDDANTLCHEMFHAVNDHELVPRHGPIMSFVSALNAELVGVIGDALWYEVVRKEIEVSGDELRLLAHVLQRLKLLFAYLVESAVHWSFERRIHAVGRPQMPEEFAHHSVDAWKEVFGTQGRNEVAYASIDYYWTMCENSGDPFYVFAYPCAVGVAQAILNRRKEMKDDFQPQLMQLLRSNSMLRIDELAAPFGVDIHKPFFFRQMFKSCLQPLMDEAQWLAKKLKLI